MKSKKPQPSGLSDIHQFMTQKNVAIAGISRNDKKFGNAIFKALHDRNYQLFPIHQQLESFEGVGCFKAVDALPGEVSALIICTRPDKTVDLVHSAIAKGIKHIWLQQGAQNDEAIEFARSKGVNIIHRQCALMFAEPVNSVHKFHKSINKFFGIYPK